MAKRYMFVRLSAETYEVYKSIQEKMMRDIKEWSGKEVKIPLSRVFDAVVKHNRNWIEVDLNKIAKRVK